MVAGLKLKRRNFNYIQVSESLEIRKWYSRGKGRGKETLSSYSYALANVFNISFSFGTLIPSKARTRAEAGPSEGSTLSKIFLLFKHHPLLFSCLLSFSRVTPIGAALDQVYFPKLTLLFINFQLWRPGRGRIRPLGLHENLLHVVSPLIENAIDFFHFVELDAMREHG